MLAFATGTGDWDSSRGDAAVVSTKGSGSGSTTATGGWPRNASRPRFSRLPAEDEIPRARLTARTERPSW